MENIQSIWDEILLAVKDDYEIADVSFNTWLAPLKIVSVDGNDLTVMASDETDEMAINYISKKYEKQIGRAHV